MPTLHLRLSPPQTPVRHAQLAQALTALTARVLGKRADLTALLIDNLPAERWFIGGFVPAQPTALLEIDITLGTNTADEKAAFIAETFDELQLQLGGPLAPASYVIVREVPAADWGYGGLTQQARQAHRLQAASSSWVAP